MNKLISSALLTVVAVPFLMAAPVAKKAQNTTTPNTSTATTKKATKKHAKKSSSTAASTMAAPKK